MAFVNEEKWKDAPTKIDSIDNAQMDLRGQISNMVYEWFLINRIETTRRFGPFTFDLITELEKEMSSTPDANLISGLQYFQRKSIEILEKVKK